MLAGFLFAGFATPIDH